MNTILIDHKTEQHPQALLFQDPIETITAHLPGDVPNALSRLEHLNEQGYYLAGFFSYELGYLFEERLKFLLPENRRFPLLWFGAFESPNYLGKDNVTEWLDEQRVISEDNGYRLSVLTPACNRVDYHQRFAEALKNIETGDIYQLNLTFQTHFQFSGCPFSLYRDLKQKQKMSHGAVLSLDEFTILSASPEHFLSIENNMATTIPMKGTVRRGLTYDRDNQLKSWLKEDIKSRAENLMIVDLMRNDLGRISEIGSVQVNSLFDVETYPTLHQLTSNVTSQLKPDLKLSKLIKALFPPGSITGAPKVRAMELINKLESEERGVYTGTIGYICPKKKDGIFPKTYFNVAIRTLTLWPDGCGQIGIGSGVVSDSVVDEEYDECLLKMQFTQNDYPEFQLIETIAYSPQRGYHYYEYHLERLANSASYFNYTLDLDHVAKRLKELELDMQDSSYMVRLLLSEDGRLDISFKKFELPPAGTVMKFVISEKRMDRNNVFLYHKTTNRAFYDDEHKIKTSEFECDEVLFLNHENEITEGSRTNIFVEIGEKIITPRIECGLLAGTLRSSLLHEKKVIEGILTLEDLDRANNIYLGNSVRGLLRAEKINIH